MPQHDPNASLGVMLSFLSQGMQGDQNVSLPEFQAPPQMAPLQMPGMSTPARQGSGIGQSIISSLLDEFMTNRKLKKQAEAINEFNSKLPKDISEEERNLAYISSPFEQLQKVGAENIKIANTPRNFQLAKVGVPGKEGYEQNVYLNEGGQPIPFGEPLKQRSGVTVNTGNLDNYITHEESDDIVDAQGNTVKLPIGTPRREAREKGLYYGKQPTQADIKQDVSIDTTNTLLNKIKSYRAKGVSISGVEGAIQDFRSSTGPLGVVTNEALNKAGYPINKNRAELQSAVKNFGNYALQVMRGASVGPEEQEKFERAMPTTGQPDEIFDANLQLAEQVFKDAMSNTSKRSGRISNVVPPMPNVGDVMDGYTFIGGDPSKKESWRQQ